MFGNRFQKLEEVVRQCVYTTQDGNLTPDEALSQAHKMILTTESNGGIVYFIGNGGSAGIASHFCNDFMKALGVPASTIFDLSLLTCFSNDYGYEQVFSKPLSILLKPNDLLIAISSSGNSPNILNGVEEAGRKNAQVITFTGFSAENRLRQRGNLNFWTGVADYGLVETAHFFLLHAIVDLWKDFLHDSTSEARENQVSSRN